MIEKVDKRIAHNKKRDNRVAKATVRSKCLVAIQLLARVAAADDNGYCECVTCGHTAKWNEGIQGGHFIPKGSCSYWALEIENVHPQCQGCNVFGMKHGDAAHRYTLWMQDYYGSDYVEEMLSKTKAVKKISKAGYEDMLKDFNEQIAHHKQRIGA